MILVNPILALEDIGVTISEDLNKHVRETLGFPEGRINKIRELRKKVRAQLAALDHPSDKSKKNAIPRTPKARADLVFTRLGLRFKNENKKVPASRSAPSGLTVEQLTSYIDEHPLLADLYKLGQLERGTIVYHSKGAYQAYKKGERIHHPWLRRLYFNVED